MDLILAIVRWENRQVSGVIFLSGLIFLGSCVLYPLHYVLTTMGLYVLMTTLAAKLYVHLMGYLKKPCKDILASLDVYEIDDAEIESFVKRSSDKLLFVLVKVRSLLFVRDFETSAKFCFLLYILSHLGSLVDSQTLLVWLWLPLFTLPVLYSQHQRQVHAVIGLLQDKMTAVNSHLDTTKQRVRKHTRFAPNVKDK